jgi:adenosine deaminase
MLFTKTHRVLASIFLLTTTSVAAAVNPATLATAHYFNTIQNNPNDLLLFLENMPKGGDLHNHLAGATYAENLLQDGTKDNFCVDSKTYAMTVVADCPVTNQIANVANNSDFYNDTINAWSMRNFYPGAESGHDHFFATFAKYFPLVSKHRGQILAEVAARAAEQHEEYLELMVTPDDDASGVFGKQIGWDSNLAQLRQKLLAQGLPKIVNTISQSMTTNEAIMRSQLMCGTDKALPGCNIKVRYLYQVLREQAPAAVFAQLLAGFEVASHDPRFVGINIVQPEDGYIALRDYDLHMRMINFLHSVYPKVGISLHAGELAPGLVTPANLAFHIRHAIEIGDAQRIGHGVDIAYEDNSKQLLQEMAAKHIDVEINLSSNDKILGVQGAEEPLPLYLQYGVPITLSTDDEGVLRTNLTLQYQRAVLTYHMPYMTLKNMVRNNITYSFLPGASLWLDAANAVPVTACQQDVLGADKTSKACQVFLAQSEKAKSQWQLESEFAQFENTFKKRS